MAQRFITGIVSSLCLVSSLCAGGCFSKSPRKSLQRRDSAAVCESRLPRVPVEGLPLPHVDPSSAPVSGRHRPPHQRSSSDPQAPFRAVLKNQYNRQVIPLRAAHRAQQLRQTLAARQALKELAATTKLHGFQQVLVSSRFAIQYSDADLLSRFWWLLERALPKRAYLSVRTAADPYFQIGGGFFVLRDYLRQMVRYELELSCGSDEELLAVFSQRQYAEQFVQRIARELELGDQVDSSGDEESKDDDYITAEN